MGSLKKAKLFIHGLHWTIGSRKLREYFMQFGEVAYCNVKFDYKTGFSKGYGFVEFTREEDAAKAVNQLSHVLLKPFSCRKSFYEEEPKQE